jgi:hypothetical protein
MNMSPTITLVETVRGVGIYALVDDAMYFVPRDHIDGMMSGHLREGGSRYREARTAVYLACGVVPHTLERFPEEEARMPLLERIVRLPRPEDAARHWQRLRGASGNELHVQLEESRILRGHVAMRDLAGRPPSAIGLRLAATTGGFANHAGSSIGVRAPSGAIVCVGVREVIFGVGTYLDVGGALYFLPTRVLGRVIGQMSPKPRTLREYADATARAYVQLPAMYEEHAANQAQVPFSRRLVRFDSDEAAVGHRTRLAAMFQLRASPTLTRPDEAPLHFIDGQTDCDRPWIASASAPIDDGGS